MAGVDGSAEAIARVVADVQAGRWREAPVRDMGGRRMTADARRLVLRAGKGSSEGPVVDATAIYRSLVARDEPVYLYEDHPCIAPPWGCGTVAYQNEHGNVVAMIFGAPEFDYTTGEVTVAAMVDGAATGRTQPEPWKPAEPVDWSRVHWLIDTVVWIGGRSPITGPFPTSGPMHMWRFAVYGDGQPADLHWVQLVQQYPMEHWDMAHLVLLGALNFMNCRNVELVEPQRPRAQARALARTGVRVSEINVFPIGRSTRGRAAATHGVPLTSVRGHFARYGPAYDRGLLFGKYEGRFWIPQHARGDRDHGEIRQTFELHPEASS
jgi:hypothetical protein